MQLNQQFQKLVGPSVSPSPSGHTMAEMTAIGMITAIMGAIALPAGLNLLQRYGGGPRQEVDRAQEMLYAALQEAQSRAIQQHMGWQVSLRERDGKVEFAMHPNLESQSTDNYSASGSADFAGIEWTPLPEMIRLDPDLTNWQTDTAGKIRQIRFNFLGHVEMGVGASERRITLAREVRGKKQNRRCVTVATLLGDVRTGKEKKLEGGKIDCRE